MVRELRDRDADAERPGSGSGWTGPRRGRKIAELLAREIVDNIVANKLRPGDMLPAEAEMIRTYAVGRATLREALRLLEVQGLIWVKPGPGGGPVLADLTPRHFGDMAKLHLHMDEATYREVLEARLAVEPLMARLAAESQGEADLERLRKVLEAADAADIQDDAAYQELSWAFHSTVASISGNRVLDLLGEALKEVYDSKIRATFMPRRQRSTVRDIHREIGEAIIEGRGADAERLMRDHMIEYAAQSAKLHPGVLDEVVIWD